MYISYQIGPNGKKSIIWKMLIFMRTFVAPSASIFSLKSEFIIEFVGRFARDRECERFADEGRQGGCQQQPAAHALGQGKHKSFLNMHSNLNKLFPLL